MEVESISNVQIPNCEVEFDSMVFSSVLPIPVFCTKDAVVSSDIVVLAVLDNAPEKTNPDAVDLIV